MARLSSTRRHAALGAAVASSLTLAAALAVPGTAGAAGHKRHSGHPEQIRVVGSKKFGKILVDSAGRTLYALTAGSKKDLTCSGACTGLWPPLLTTGKPRAAKGVDRKLLGTVKRGHAEQVTYHGWPLYTYAGDTRAGQTLGEGIKSFGGTWLLVGMHGGPVKASLAAKKSGSGSSGSSGSSW